MPHWRRALSLLLLGCALSGAGRAADADALLSEGEQALRAGDAMAAQAAFERAASLRHEAAAEWGLVRSWMQQGEYRRALAFAAHAAEGHGELAEGAGLYAWLLQVGGQTALAQRSLAAALERHPDNAALLATRQRLLSPGTVPDARLLQGPVRQAPFASSDLPAAARAVASGWLLPSADVVLAPASAVHGASTIWVRDAMGRTMPATQRREVSALKLVELSLAAPLHPATPFETAQRDAFPGSAEMVLAFGAATPAWPVLHTGFVGRWQADAWYALGAEVAGFQGGPVYDAAGRLIGLAQPGTDGPAKLLAVSAVQAQWPQAFAATQAGAARPTLSPDAVYERAMNAVVQVIVLPLRSD